MVKATRFQVEDLKSPHMKDFVFQMRHSIQPRIPLLWMT